MRTTFNIYRLLGKYLEVVDAEADARGEGPVDKSIDPHFRSGVYLGTGMSNLVLSLMPTRLLAIVELFGYKGDRQAGLEALARAGGWTDDSPEPTISAGMYYPSQRQRCAEPFWLAADEGVRRSLSDMALLIFHLVLSSYTFEGVNIKMASNILDWNLKRYPNGVLSVISHEPFS